MSALPQMANLQETDNNILYNNFFNPNICHVCKLKFTDDYEICEKCCMISYCSEEHKLVDQPHHVQLCAVIKKLSEQHAWLYHHFNLEEWIKSRKEFIRLIKAELSRELEPYEEQMIMFTKSCRICHEQQNLYTCKRCYSVNYCSVHAEALDNDGSSDCEELAMCLDINIELYSQLKCGLKSIPKIKFTNFSNKYIFSVDMSMFLEQNNFHSSALKHFYSDYISGPLTLYYGMQNLQLLNPAEIRYCYVVHIIAANIVDKQYLPAWEIILHFLRKTHNLVIVLIGSELKGSECKTIETCIACRIHYRQHLRIEYYSMLYHDYVDSFVYKRPNVILGCQIDFSNEKISSESIFKLRDQNCPLILTSKSKLKAEENISKLDEVLGSPLNIVHHLENKFSSTRPYKDFENDSVSYRNKYLTVYMNLHYMQQTLSE